MKNHLACRAVLTFCLIAAVFGMISICGCSAPTTTKKADLQYVYRPMDEDNAYLFQIDDNSNKAAGNDLHAFRRDLDRFFKDNPQFELKNWEVIEYETINLGDNKSYRIASSIVVFVRKK